jgi:hypothetical protein
MQIARRGYFRGEALRLPINVILKRAESSINRGKNNTQRTARLKSFAAPKQYVPKEPRSKGCLAGIVLAYCQGRLEKLFLDVFEIEIQRGLYGRKVYDSIMCRVLGLRHPA